MLATCWRDSPARRACQLVAPPRELRTQIGQQPGARGARRAVEEIREAATRAEGGVTKGAACLSLHCRECATRNCRQFKGLGINASARPFNYERGHAFAK